MVNKIKCCKNLQKNCADLHNFAQNCNVISIIFIVAANHVASRLLGYVRRYVTHSKAKIISICVTDFLAEALQVFESFCKFVQILCKFFSIF